MKKDAFDIKQQFFGTTLSMTEAARAGKFLAAHPAANCVYAQPPLDAVAHPNKYRDTSVCDCCGKSAADALVGIGGFGGTMYDLSDGSTVCVFCVADFGRLQKATKSEIATLAAYRP